MTNPQISNMNSVDPREEWRATCCHDQEDQTAVLYMLQRCPLLQAERLHVWPTAAPRTTRLFGCRQELEKPASFVTRAGEADIIYHQSWRIRHH